MSQFVLYLFDWKAFGKMTSWPWMKDVQEAVANPIAPINEHDDRQSVKALLTEHGDKIEKIREGIKDDPLFDGRKHDDLWILRFWLSHKKTKQAIAAAKSTLELRNKYNLDSKDIRGETPHKTEEPRSKEYWEVRCRGDGIVCAVPDKQRGVICFIKFAQMNPEAAKLLSQETWDYAFIYNSEWTFQWLDYVTRTTGRLTKSVRLVDMSGLSLGHFDRASTKRDGKIMNEMEDMYPQLLDTLYGCYPPSFMHTIWSFLRPIMPKRIIDKIDLVEPGTNKKERDRLLKHISLEDLPVYFGGKNEVPPKDWDNLYPWKPTITDEIET